MQVSPTPHLTLTHTHTHPPTQLQVYRYTSWGGNANLPPMAVGQQLAPSELSLKEGATAAPQRLSERDLISAMERHGIGTDATVSSINE